MSGKTNVVSYIIPIGHFNDDELAQRGLRSINSDNANRDHNVDTEVVWTPSSINIVEVITNVAIMVTNSYDWSVLPLGSTERICSSFEGCSVPLYECLFTKLRVRPPFFDFEVVVMNHLRVAPLQLHPRSMAYMKVF